MEPDKKTPLRVMTYNVRRCLGLDGTLSVERVAETILQCNADIVALQELDVGRERSRNVDQANEISRLIGATNVYFHPTLQIFEERYGDALITRIPAELIKAAALPRDRQWKEPRGAIWATVKWQGQKLQVINTHLGLGRRERMLQIEHLLGPGWLQHPRCIPPVILLGDLNSLPRGRVYQTLAHRLIDAQLAAGGLKRPTYPSHFPMLRIDHVFVTDDIVVEGAEVWKSASARLASDHLPLVVDLQPTAKDPAH